MAVTLTDIHSLDIYKDIITLGARDLGTSTRSRRPELKINVEHPALGTYSTSRGPVIGNITLFQTGYIRLFRDAPSKVENAIGGDKKYVMNIHEWEGRLEKVFNYILKGVVTNEMKLAHSTYNYVLQNKKTFASKLQYLVSHKPVSFFNWVKTLDPVNAETVIDLVAKDVVGMINAKPGQWAFTLKKVYKNPAIKRLIPKLDKGAASTFASDLGLAGDLHDLGF